MSHPVITSLCVVFLSILSVESASTTYQLNGKNVATVTTAQQQCCGGGSTEVTTGLTATLSDKNTKRTSFGKSFNGRMDQLNQHQGDQKGHILASVLGGPADTWNLAPQAENVNKKVRANTSILNSWYDCEKWIQKQLETKKNLPIKVTIKLTYTSAGGCRPTKWSISATNSNNSEGCKATDVPNGTDPHFGVCQAPRGG